jgi:thioesterase domain-containing protein
VQYLAGIFSRRRASVVPASASDFATEIRNSLNAYRPEPLPVKIHVFLAAARLANTTVLEDARLGWRDFAPAGCDIHRIAAEHNSMFVEPYVEQLAAAVAGALTISPSNAARSARA